MDDIARPTGDENAGEPADMSAAIPDAANAVSEPGDSIQDAPPDAEPASEKETDEQWILRFLEENQHLARPRPERPPPPPPSPWDGPPSIWKVPDHLSMRHPKGGYMAMALLSRTMDDLDEVTKGERAATYEEVDKYLGHALIAEGLVPFAYTADEAIWWWKSGGYKVLRGASEAAPESSLAIRAAGESLMTNDSAPIETPEAQGAVPIGSPGGTNFNGMTIDEGVDASLAPAEAPTGDSSKAAAPPTTLSDVIKDVGTWGRLKPPSPSPRGKNGVGAASPGSGVTEAPRRKIPIQDAVPSIPVEGKGATLRRSWPVPVPSTGVRFPRRGEKDLNGVRYSDGRYSPEGRYRTKKGSGKPQSHRGSDVPGALGTPVRSAADGVVLQRGTQWAKVWARDPKTNKLLLKKNRNGKMVPYKVQGKGPEMAGWGNFITVLHPDGYISLYAHLQTVPSLKDGTSVRLGQQIGILGSTGNARGQGSHVHIEVRDRRGNTYNPVDWMEGRLPPRKD